MKVLNFFRKSEQGDSILILDIESNYIKSAIINVDNTKKEYRITDSHKEWRETQFLGSSVIDNADLKLNIQKSITNLLRKRKSVSFKNMVVLASEEIFNNILFGAEFIREDKEKKIEMREIKDMLQKASENIKAQAVSDIDSQDRYIQSNIKIADGELQNVLVDGYEVATPLGFKGKKVAINIFASVIFDDVWRLFDDLAKEFDIKTWGFKSKMGLLTNFAKRKLKKDDAILINIADDYTELLFLEKGYIKNTGLLPIGNAHFTKLLARNLGIGFYEAEDIKLKYISGKLKKPVMERIAEILLKDITFFTKELEGAFTDLIKHELMPQDIYVAEGDMIESEFKKLKIDTSINFISNATLTTIGFDLTNKIELNGLNSLFKKLIQPI